MIYTRQSGTVVNTFELLDEFHSFILNNATNWTINKYADLDINNSRKGKHLAIQKGNYFFNFNSSDYRTPWYTGSGSLYDPISSSPSSQKTWLGCNISLGFDDLLYWNQQPGYFSHNNSGDGAPYINCLIIDQLETSCNYDFFMSQDQSVFILVTEYQPNKFTHMIFGDFNRGTWINDNNETGQFCTSSIKGSTTSSTGISENSYSSNSYIRDPLFIDSDISTSNHSLNVYNRYEGIKKVNFSNTNYTSSITSFGTYVGSSYYYDPTSTYSQYQIPQSGYPAFSFRGIIQYLTINNFNNNTTMIPVEYYCKKDANNFCKLGTIEDVYIINMKTFSNRDIINLGSEQYIVLPFFSKRTPQSYDDSKDLGMGYAVRIA